jgi:hypothetical protein
MGPLVMGRFESGTFPELDLLYVHPNFTISSGSLEWQLWHGF